MSILDNISRRVARFGRRAVSDYYPDLRDRQHLTSGIHETPDVLQNYVSYATVYQSYTWVRKAISVSATAIKPLPRRVIDVNGKALSSPLNNLLAMPNDQQDSSAFVEDCYVYSMLAGEIPIEIVSKKNGQPGELWVRRPDWVTIIPDMERAAYPRPLEYLYYDPDLIPNTARTDEDRRQHALRIPAESFIFDRFHNPLNKWRGLAPITAVRNGITIDLLAQSWSKSFLGRGARPDYAIKSPQPLMPVERDALEAKMLAKFGGPDGWHLPIILDDGAEIQVFSWAPKDMEWLQQREFARDEVGAIFGVPDEIMGFGKDTYENFDMAYRVLWLLTLQPWLTRFDVVLTNHFRRIGQLQPNERIATDLTSVGVLQEDDAPRIDKASKLFAMGVPFNTLDDRLRLGIGPVPGGEIGYLGSSLLPADMMAVATPGAPLAPVAPEQRRMLPPVRRRITPEDLTELVRESEITELAAALADKFSEE